MAPSRKKGAIKARTSFEFRHGDLVLAKVLGFPPWPAKVSRPEDWERVSDPKKYFVQFFGTQELAFVAPPDVQAFTSESKSKLVAKCKGKTIKYYAQAVKEIFEAFEELEKNDLSRSNDDTTTHGHDAHNIEERNANGSYIEKSTRPKYEELSVSESSVAQESIKNSGRRKLFEKVKETSGRSSVISSSIKELGLVDIKADIVGHRERIESSRASSSSPYSSHSEVKRVTSQHGDGKMDSPASLGGSGNLKSSKKSANGQRSVELIAGSKRKLEGVLHRNDDAKSGLSVKDRVPQKLVGQEKRLGTSVNKSEPGSREKVLEGALKSVKKSKLVHSTSDAVKGSIVKSENIDLETKIHDDENVRSFGPRNHKSDITKKRRAVCLYNDDDNEKPKTPVHGRSLLTSKVDLPTILPDSLKKNNVNHENTSCIEESHKDGIDYPNSQESQSPKKEEISKQFVKEDKKDLLSPGLSPSAKKLVDQRKPNRTPSKVATLNSHIKAQNVPGKDLKSISSGSNSSQKRKGPFTGEMAKGVPKISVNGPGSPLDSKKDHNSALGDGRTEDAKDSSNSLVDSKTLNSAMSMKHLIAAAQAKRRQALKQTAPQNTDNSLSASTGNNVHLKCQSPTSMVNDMPSSGIVNVTKSDPREVHPQYLSSPNVQIRELDSKEVDNKGPGSGNQVVGSTLSGGTDAAVARDAFEGMIETLSRTKESIGRATRLAIDCAKYGIANEVVELLIRKLENESLMNRRVDLFFLVDSITQCSHSQKGVASASYIPIVQTALGRLLGAAAPSGTSAQENRRQCLKVLRLWLERKIFPESVLRRFMDDIGSSNENTNSGFSFRRPSRAERSVDDPIREMEGMLVDEYGSNSTFNLPGFLSTHGFVDNDDEDEEEKPNTSLKEANTSPLQPSNNSEGLETGPHTPNDKHHHILEKVDVELEMEDVSLNLNDETLSKEFGAEMCLDTTNLEDSINDVVDSPLLEGSPPLPPESPPPLPPLPTSPPPPLPPLSPPPPPPSPPPLPPPPTLPSQPFLPPLVSSGLSQSQVGNPQPLLPPQPSVASQVFLRPPSGVPSLQAHVDYNIPIGTHPACNIPQQVPCFPTPPSGSLDTPGYSSVYGGTQTGSHYNQQFQQSSQFQPGQPTFVPRPFPSVTLPQPSSSHFSYNNPPSQLPMPQSRPIPPPIVPSHSFSLVSHSESLRQVGDEHKSIGQHNSWLNGGRMPSCPPPTNFIGEAYFRPEKSTDSMGYQVSGPKPAMAGHGINQMMPSRPDMPSLNYWRPV